MWVSQAVDARAVLCRCGSKSAMSFASCASLCALACSQQSGVIKDRRTLFSHDKASWLQLLHFLQDASCYCQYCSQSITWRA